MFEIWKYENLFHMKSHTIWKKQADIRLLLFFLVFILSRLLHAGSLIGFLKSCWCVLFDLLELIGRFTQRPTSFLFPPSATLLFWNHAMGILLSWSFLFVSYVGLVCWATWDSHKPLYYFWTLKTIEDQGCLLWTYVEKMLTLLSKSYLTIYFLRDMWCFFSKSTVNFENPDSGGFHLRWKNIRVPAAGRIC